MKKILKITALLMALCTLVLCGCQQGPSEPTDAVYSVRVVNGAGKPFTSGVIVQIFKGQEQVAMQAVNQEGKVEKTLPLGEYTVQLRFTGDASGYYYDESSLVLTAQSPVLDIALYAAVNTEGEKVYDQNGETMAYSVALGSTYVKLESGKRNYFLFAAQTPGLYRFSTSHEKAVIGYYGYTSYIRDTSIIKLENGAMEMNITASMVGTEGMSNPYVLGVDADGIEGCILTIERISDPEYTIEENEPWVIYKPTVELTKFTTPEGTIRYFDLTASTDTYNIVFNENDKTYHLGTAEGPQVLVQLGKPTTYLPAISEICTTTGVKKYFFDADGKFIKREDYTECLQIYSKNKETAEGDRGQSAGTEIYLDVATGLYPLTEDLKYIIQNHGGYAGWWDESKSSFLFQDADGNRLVGVNPEIAWLFLCCYVEA